MFLKRFVTTLFVLSLCLWLAAKVNCSLAQEESQAAATDASISPEVEVQEETADDEQSVYLRGEDGQPVAVPRLQYQEFYRFLRSQFMESLASNQVASLQSFDISGEVKDGYAEVEIHLKAEVREQLVAPVRLPIELSNLIIKQVEPSGDYLSQIAPVPVKPTTAEVEADRSAQTATATTASQVNVSEGSQPLEWKILPRDGSAETKESQTQTCSITIRGFLPVTESSQQQITFNLPQVAGVVRMKLPVSAREIAWSGNSNQKLTQQETADHIQLERVGLGDTSQMTWSDAGRLEAITAIEVSSNTRFIASIDGKPWSAVTKISLKQSGATSVRDLIVQLPSNSTWNPSVDSAITQVDSADVTDGSAESTGTSGKPPRLRVRTNDEIRWTWQPPARLDQDFALPTIVVEKAQRHEGTIEVLVSPRVQFAWKTDSTSGLSKRLIEPGGPELFNYAFTFTKAPTSILCSLRESGYRLQYRPEYLVQLKESSIELTGLLNFAVDPSQMIGLEINVGPWAVKQILWAQSGQPIDFQQASVGVVRFDPASLYRRVDATGASVVASTGRTIQIELVKAIDASQGWDNPSTEVVLPTITWLDEQGNSITEVGNGWLTISPNDWNVERSNIELQSLTPIEQAPASLEGLIKSNQLASVQTYLFTQQEKQPRWFSRLNRKPNLATQYVHTGLSFDETSYQLEKTWKIEQNKWKDLSFFFYVPDSLSEDLLGSKQALPADRRAIFTMNGKRIPCEAIPADEIFAADASEQPKSAEEVSSQPEDSEPQTRKGKYPPPMPGWLAVRPVFEDLPTEFELKLQLTEPISLEKDADKVSSDAVRLAVGIPYLIASSPLMTIDRQVDISVINTWKALVQANDQTEMILPGQINRPRMFADNVTSFDVTLERLSKIERAAVRVRQIWLQTALNGSERRDRCVIDLTTAGDQLELNLSAGDINNLTSVLVNGQRVDPQRVEGTSSLILMLPKQSFSSANTVKDSGNASSAKSESSSEKIVVNGLPTNATSQRYTIELWIWSTVSQQLIYRVSENLPRIVNATEPAPRYWQIVVPQHDHLWTKSSALLPEYQWKWSGLTLQRATALEQADLERMTGASEQASFGLDANRYLFSSLATSLSPSRMTVAQHVYIVPRYLLFAPVGLFCIALACLMLYLPWLRSIWMVGAMAFGATLVSAVSVDVALMLAQSVVGASLLVAVLLLVRWSISRRVDQRSVFANRSRVTASTVTPIEPVNFGGDDASQSKRGDSYAKNSNSSLGTTRSLQSISPDPDVTTDRPASVIPPSGKSIEGAPG